MNIKSILFSLSFCILVLVARAQSGNLLTATLLTKSPDQYLKMEWNIPVSGKFKNPYDQKEVMLDLWLTSPSGKPLQLPCYFEKKDNGTSLFKARFTPQESGKYSYYFKLITGKTSQDSKPESFTARKTQKKGFMHKNNNYTFKFDNGELFRGVGENVAWESRDFENQKFTYDYLLPTLAKNGANFFRTWMSYWNIPLEWKKVGGTKRYQNSDDYFNPGAIKRMDELVQLTDSLGLYFMLTLDWHGHLMQNFKRSNYSTAMGGPAATPTEYFTLPASMEMYKNKLRYVVGRWGYSTNIAAWEFFNEIDNAAFGAKDSVIIPLAAINHWHQEMSRYLKDLDPYQHLVTTSVSHRDIPGMNSIPYIDFNQKHIYKHTEKIPGIYPDYIQTFNKPYVVGEFGFRWEDMDPKYAKEANYDYKRGLWFGMFSETPILPMTWWWELFDDQKMTPYFNSVRKISDMMLAAGKGKFQQFKPEAGLLHAQGMQCGNSYFVYLLNETEHEVAAAVSFPVAKATGALQSFDPEGRKFAILKSKAIAGNTLTLAVADGVKLKAGESRVLIFGMK
ncbi:DUF5060 domain-containing protein [Pedobacter duraquae]|uniref:Uncharacterized protein DUF5060 n=1 Tax=Pedobacter duraquae TaxID=425511 RepID=A0A4R6IPL8_9SPHI|nr:DUF5060 domain-containing protein [Pedobacter duraquae]TDO24239.1 uncharacterized protein DUF5060 [Pedobacter duraquae]